MSKNPMSKNPLKNNKKLFKLLPIAFVVMTSFEAIAQSNETSIEVTADKVPDVMRVVPGDAKLESRMPQTFVSQEYLENFVSPTASFVEAVAYAPSVLGVSTNGPGLNDNKVSLRGFNNNQFTMAFDGIPINDTNGVSYHSTIWAPSQFIGSAGVDRSPGLASSFGPANYGGTFNFYSKETLAEKGATLYGSIGSYGTKLLGADFQTGAIGSEGKTKVAAGVHQMFSDGYQTGNSPRRYGGYFKLDTELTNDVKLTLFSSFIDYFTNGPDGLKVYAQDTNPALAGINPNYKGQNYFASKDPTRVDFNGYPTVPNGVASTEVRTYLNYIGLNANISDSWRMENKLYNMSYNNHDTFNTVGSPNQTMTSVSASAMNYLATDKHNTFQKFGDILRFFNDNSLGQFRTGLWYEYAVSSRFQTFFNPLTGAALTPVNTKFAENYTTTTFQPFVEFEFKVTDKLKITPGFKYSLYNMSLSQNPDIGNSGPGGGYVGSATYPVLNNATYRSPNPFLDIHYMIQPNWSVYAQFASGDVVPSTTVFDNKLGTYQTGTTAPTVLPPPIQTKSYQIGSVFKGKNYSVDGDIYLTRADGSLTAVYDAATYNTYYLASGSGTYSGIEAQGTYAFENGISVYGNASKMNAKYDSNGLNMPSVPTDMETLGLFYKSNGWTSGAFVKRVGPQWVDSKTVQNEWAQLDPIFLTGLYLNYEFNNLGPYAKSARIRFGVDNVFDKIYLTSYTPAGASSDPNRPGANINTNTLNNDTVTWSSGRFTSVSLFVNF
jgi:iron complex outermembrane receptor protein